MEPSIVESSVVNPSIVNPSIVSPSMLDSSIVRLNHSLLIFDGLFRRLAPPLCLLLRRLVLEMLSFSGD